MNSEFADFLAGVCVGCLVACILLKSNDYDNARKYQQELIRSGAAMYVCDPETGRVEIQYTNKRVSEAH